MRNTKYDWVSIQKEYNSGLSERMLQSKYGISAGTFTKAIKAGRFIRRSHAEAMKLASILGRTSHPCSQEKRLYLSKIAKERGYGGDLPTKCYTYNGYKLRSSYELRVAKILDNANVVWIRPKSYFIWIDDNGKDHRYHPDFYLPNLNIYLDPKNSYLMIKDEQKLDRVRKENMIKVYAVPIHLIEKWERYKFDIADLV